MSRNSTGDTATQAKTRAEIFGTGDSSDNEDAGDKTKDTRTMQEMMTRTQRGRRGRREDDKDTERMQGTATTRENLEEEKGHL